MKNLTEKIRDNVETWIFGQALDQTVLPVWNQVGDQCEDLIRWQVKYPVCYAARRYINDLTA